MGLFDNIRHEILEEFNIYTGCSHARHQTTYTYSNFNNQTHSQHAIDKIANSIELVEKLEFKRWGYSPVCPSCGWEKCYLTIKGIRRYRCGNPECRIDFNVFRNTILCNTKIDFNKWYDMAKEYRDKGTINTVHFAKANDISQKTSWGMFQKIKSSPLALEHDVSIFHVLLAPELLHKNRKSIKPPYKVWKQTTIKNIRSVYGEQDKNFAILNDLIQVMEVSFSCNQRLLCDHIGLGVGNLNRYFKGTRKVTPQVAEKIEFFIARNTMNEFAKMIA